MGAVGLGAAHAFEPDHMAAVSTFVAKKPSPRDAAMFGVKWATGHGLSLLLFGSLLYFLKGMIEEAQPTLFSSGVLDRFVGVALIGLGVWTLLQERVLDGYKKKKRRELDAQIRLETERQNALVQDEELPLFGAPGSQETRAILPGAELLRQSNKNGSLLMGMLHGAAGTGAFVVQAVNAQSAHSYAMVVAFTLVFSVGVLGSMALYAGMLGGAISWGGRRGAQFVRFARATTGVLACIVGVYMVRGLDVPWFH